MNCSQAVILIKKLNRGGKFIAYLLDELGNRLKAVLYDSEPDFSVVVEDLEVIRNRIFK